MRRFLLIAALVVAVVVTPASAQMHGAGRSGGGAPRGFGHGGFAPHAGFAPRGGFAPHAGFAPRTGFGPQSRFGVGFGFAPRGHFGNRGFFFPNHRFFGRSFFRQGFFGFWPGWWVSPYYSYPYYSYPYADYSYDSSEGIDYSNAQVQQQLQSDIHDLTGEVRNLRQELENARQAPRTAPAPQAEAPAKVWPTVLVFRDGHRVEVQNYAIVGQTLWILAEKRATKVPISNLDVDATVKANESRGIEFHVPQKES